MRDVLLVGLGGMAGSILRYAVSTISQGGDKILGVAPGTLTVNIVGSLLLGLVLGISESEEITSSALRPLLITGFLGGFTTFSAFGGETVTLLRQGALMPGIVYILLHIVVGIGAVWAGLRIGGA